MPWTWKPIIFIDGELHEHDWGKQGEHDGRRRRGRCAFIPWYVCACVHPDRAGPAAGSPHTPVSPPQ